MQSQYPVIEAVLMGIRAMKTSPVVVARESYLRAARRARPRKGTAPRCTQQGYPGKMLRQASSPPSGKDPQFFRAAPSTPGRDAREILPQPWGRIASRNISVFPRAAEIGSALR